MQHTARPIRRGSVAGALILIVLGFLWLLNNLGYLPQGFWYNIWRFWPIVVVLVGVDVALRGFPNWFALPVLILAVVVIVGAVLLVAPTLGTAGAVTESAGRDLADLSQARIRLEVDRGTLSVQSLVDRSDQLVRGQFRHHSSIVIDQDFSASSGRGDLRLADRYEAFFPFWFFLQGMENDWVVDLTRRIPLELEIHADNSQLDLNLSDLSLEVLGVELDGCRGEVALPLNGVQNASLSLDDETEVIVSVPAGVAARIRLRLDDSEVAIDSSRFAKVSESEYVSPDYAEAETTVDLTIEATDSSASVK